MHQRTVGFAQVVRRHSTVVYRVNRLPFSPARVRLIAQNTVREATRQRLFNFIALLAAVLVTCSQWLRELSFGSSELKFIADFGFGAMAFFGSALAIVATSQLFFSEIEQRTVFTLLAKPVWRAEFVLGKFIGVTAITAAFCGVMTVLLIAVLWTRESTLISQFPEAFQQGRAVNYVAVVVAGFAQALKLGLLSALTLLVASFARTQLFTTAVGFMFLVICHLQFLAGTAADGRGQNITRLVTKVISVSLPNFQLFDFSDSLGSGEKLAWMELGRLTLYTGGYAMATCLFAVFAFRRREI